MLRLSDGAALAARSSWGVVNGRQTAPAISFGTAIGDDWRVRVGTWRLTGALRRRHVVHLPLSCHCDLHSYPF